MEVEVIHIRYPFLVKRYVANSVQQLLCRTRLFVHVKFYELNGRKIDAAKLYDLTVVQV